MKCFFAIGISLFSLIPDVVAQSRQYNFSRLDNNDGLSHNQVNSIFKDSQGFMWFGTMSGLNRFDGYDFKVFLHGTEDSTSVSDNFIENIFEDPNGKIWVDTRIGINIYDPFTESFSLPAADYFREFSLPDSSVANIIKGSNGVFWFVHESNGLYGYNGRDKSTRHLVHIPGDQSSLATDHIACIAEAPNGNFWLVHKNGILENMDPASGKIIFRDSTLSKTYESRYSYYQIFADTGGDLWIYAVNEPSGIFYFDTSKNTFLHLCAEKSQPSLSSDLIRGVTQDKNGIIWIGTDHGGVNLLSKETFTVQYLLSRPDDENSLSQNSIYTLYRDNTGIIWLGTVKYGISYYHEDIFKFPLYNSKTSYISGFNFNDINHFAEDEKGNLWIGTNGGGLYYFDRSTGKAKRYLHNPKDPNSLSNDVIICMLIDSNKKLWIGTYYGGLSCFNGKKFINYKHDPNNPNSISDDRIWTIYEDPQKNLWIGTLGGGLERFDRRTKTFVHYKAGEEGSIHTDEVTSILEDKNGNFFVASYFGLNVKEKSKDYFVHYTTDDISSGLSSNNIFLIMEDSRGLVWLATRDGLNLFDKKNKTFRGFKKEDGLPDNMIMSIREDDHQNLWLSTPNGLSQLIVEKKAEGDQYSFTFKNYDKSDGLQGKSFNEKAGLKTRKGELVFGGPNGFNIFDPDKIENNEIIPPVVLTDFQIFNNSIKPGEKINDRIILPQSISRINTVVLQHDENMFSIEFAALNYIHPEKNQYAYMLEGFNKEWLAMDGRSRMATYTNLNPGEYTFRVKASNNDGIWNEESIAFDLVILPPFWKTDPAFALYIFIVMGLLFFARLLVQKRERMRFDIEQERREAKRIHELDLMKIKFFTNISHEFRTPLTLILTPLDKILKSTSDLAHKKQLDMIYRNGRRLLNLVNQLLDFRKIEVQGIKLNPSEGDIISFTKEVAYSFSDLSEKKNIKFSFLSDTSEFNTFFDHDKLEKILFNLLSNAFKFTPELGGVEMNINLQDGEEEEVKKLEIKVKDTGIGIPADKKDAVFERFFQNDVSGSLVNQGSGIGLSITHEFVKLHGGSISVESEPEKGSCFTVSLPLKPLSSWSQSEGKPDEIVLLQPKEMISRNMTSDQTRKKISVLMVEDNEDFRFYLKDNLKTRFRVLEAGNGLEGFRLAVDHLPDLIVSDIAMPEMDGLELCRKIKSDKRTAHIPVILLTARTGEEQVLQGYDTGAIVYITKPFNFEILVSRIKSILFQKETFKKAFREKIDVSPKEMEIMSLDDKLIQKAIELVEKNISNPDFSVTDLSRELSMSRAQLYKKIFSLTGKSPILFIRTIRLKRAAQLLKKSQLTISEIAYEVGYNDPKYFTKSFKSEFKKLPSEYINDEET